jgi:hypothetical protein
MTSPGSNRINRFFLYAGGYLAIASSYAVEVVENAGEQTQNTGGDPSGGIRGAVIFIVTLMVMGVLVALVLLGFGWIVAKIYKKFVEENKRKRDFLYYNYLNNIKQCRKSADPKMKFRLKRYFGAFFRRRPVFIKKQDGSYEKIGDYDGEANKKESYHIIAIHNKTGIFKYETSILWIPTEMKPYLVEKFSIQKEKSLIINCEGVDNIAEREYNLMPLIPDPSDRRQFLDFSQMIHHGYMEKVTYQSIIDEQLQSYREGMIKSIEMNPNLNMGRRNQ